MGGMNMYNVLELEVQWPTNRMRQLETFWLYKSWKSFSFSFFSFSPRFALLNQISKGLCPQPQVTVRITSIRLETIVLYAWPLRAPSPDPLPQPY